MKNIYKFTPKLTSLLLVFVLLLSNSVPVSALSKAALEAIIKGRPWYTPGDSICASTTVANGSLDRFLQVLAFQESRGNPTASNGASSASGKYQYINGTWRSVGGRFYGPSQQYARAKDAPEEVQDAVAYLEYTSAFRSFNGDLFKLAVNHYYPIANKNPGLLDKNPPSNNISPRQYADMLIKNVNNGTGKEIQLKYAQAPDFQTWLTKVGGAPAAGASSTTPTSAASTGCGAAGVPDGQFVLYNQYDPKWKSHPYGSSTIAISGCGPAAVAMIVATLVDKSVTPVEAADFGTKNNAFVDGIGSDHVKMLKQGPEHWGLKVQSLGTSMSAAVNTIKQGGLVIATGTGPPPFTTGGHVIVLRGIDANGKFLVGDSDFEKSHATTNTTAFDPEVLLKSLTSLWGVTK